MAGAGRRGDAVEPVAPQQIGKLGLDARHQDRPVIDQRAIELNQRGAGADARIRVRARLDPADADQRHAPARRLIGLGQQAQGHFLDRRAAQAAAKQPTRYDRHCLSDQRIANSDQDMPYVVRMKVPEGETTFTDLVRGEITVNNKEIDDQVLLKSDGFPTYHLAVVVDDHHMQVSHVFRAEEWLPSTPKHLILYHMFGWTPPLHAHFPMILNKERRKLSKRKDGETVWIANYRRKGYLPAAMVNYLALLGWNPGDEREFFTIDELVKEFTLDRVHRAGAIFDLEKLNFINAHYLRQLTNDEIVEQLRTGNFLSPELSQQDNRQLARWVQITRERMQILAEFEPLVWPIISQSDYPASRLIFKKSDQEKTLRALKLVKKVIVTSPESGWDNQDDLQVQLSHVVADGDFTNGDVFWSTRVALSGLEASPSPAELLWVLGKVEGLTRVERAIVKLS